MNDNDKPEFIHQLFISLLLIISQNEIADEITINKCLKTSK